MATSPAALAALQRAFALKPQDEEVRGLLVSTFLAAIQDDFAGQRQLAPQIEPLINSPEQQLEYLRLLAMGLHASGQLREALDAYARLVDLVLREGERMPSWWEDTLAAGPGWSVRLDRWLQSRFEELGAAGDDSVRTAIGQLVQARLQPALAGSREDLRRFLAIFGRHALAQPARLRLVEEQLKSNAWLAAETELAALQASSDEAVSRAATALLAKTLTLAGQNELAVEVYRQLAASWSNTVCFDGKTGQQLLEEAREKGPLKAEFAVDRAWPAGRVAGERVEPGSGAAVLPSSVARFPPGERGNAQSRVRVVFRWRDQCRARSRRGGEDAVSGQIQRGPVVLQPTTGYESRGRAGESAPGRRGRSARRRGRVAGRGGR